MEKKTLEQILEELSFLQSVVLNELKELDLKQLADLSRKLDTIAQYNDEEIKKIVQKNLESMQKELQLMEAVKEDLENNRKYIHNVTEDLMKRVATIERMAKKSRFWESAFVLTIFAMIGLAIGYYLSGAF